MKEVSIFFKKEKADQLVRELLGISYPPPLISIGKPESEVEKILHPATNYLELSIRCLTKSYPFWIVLVYLHGNITTSLVDKSDNKVLLNYGILIEKLSHCLPVICKAKLAIVNARLFVNFSENVVFDTVLLNILNAIAK